MNIRKSATILFALSLVALAAPAAFADAVITPVPGALKAGGVFTVSIQITGPTVAGVPSGVSNLYAYQFDVSYPSNLVEALVVKDGGFLAGSGSTSFFPGRINAAAGTITTISGTAFGNSPGASGSGTLVNITFQALTSGTPQITISNITLVDSQMNPVVIDDTPSQVSATVSVTLAAARRPHFHGNRTLLSANQQWRKPNDLTEVPQAGKSRNLPEPAWAPCAVARVQAAPRTGTRLPIKHPAAGLQGA